MQARFYFLLFEFVIFIVLSFTKHVFFTRGSQKVEKQVGAMKRTGSAKSDGERRVRERRAASTKKSRGEGVGRASKGPRGSKGGASTRALGAVTAVDAKSARLHVSHTPIPHPPRRPLSPHFLP